MADENEKQEATKKPRPFGPFLLFLMVLVVVLVAFGNSRLASPETVTQDQFWWKLWNGKIAALEIHGEHLIQASDVDGRTRYEVSFTEVAPLEEQLRQAKASRGRLQIEAADLRVALEQNYISPEIHRHLTGVKTTVTETRDESGQTQVESRETTQTDLFLLEGTALPQASWRALDQVRNRSWIKQLPENGGKVWLRVEQGSDLADLKSKLTAAGSTEFNLAFDLSEGGGTSHGEPDTTLGSIMMFWGPWLLIFFVVMIFMRQMRGQGGSGGVMNFGRSRAQRYTKENHTGVTFEDVAGALEAKDEVREIVEFLRNPGRFTQIGGRIPRGVLLTGPPGCGKTLLAKAIAGEAEVPFFSISGSDFVEMFVGVGASRVRDLFKQARESTPCIIFLDEIDAVGRRRGSGMGGGHDEREQTLNAILVEMDGFGTDDGIILVAATNRPDVLDPALLRPGRFDREVIVDLPDLDGRRQILDVHLRKVRKSKSVDSELVAKATPGYSGADLAAIINEAAIMAVLEQKDEIEMEHLEEAAAKVRYGRRKTSHNIEPDDLEVTAYHEAGHTIVAAKLEHVDPPAKVTIVPRGRALGSTMMLPEKESYHMQRRRMLGQLATLFGGRIAEDVFCGDVSAGASDDIRRATDLARAMVTELGMSDKIGPINYSERQGSDFLGSELFSGKLHSEETAREIDEEVERILREAYETARHLITEHSDALKRLTAGLMKYETIDKDEIFSLIDGADPETLRPEPSEGIEESTQAEESSTHPPREENTEETDDFSGEAGLSPA